MIRNIDALQCSIARRTWAVTRWVLVPIALMSCTAESPAGRPGDSAIAPNSPDPGASAGDVSSGASPSGVSTPAGSDSPAAVPTVFMPAPGETAVVNGSEVPVIEVGGAQLKLEVCADNIVRVAYARDPAFFARQSLAAQPKRCGDASVSVASNDTETTLATPRLGVRVDRASGRVSFFDSAGALIATEASDGRTLTPASIQGEETNSVRQQWDALADESLYGLGQQQYGLLDIKGYDLDLKQYNTQVTVPFLVSSRGYGILWDNTSFSRFGDLRPFEAIPGTTGLYTGAPGGEVSSAAGSVDWQGTVQAPETGDYLFQTYASGDVKLWVNDELVIDHWRQGWLPYTELARVRLEAGQDVTLRLAWTSDIGVNALRLGWKTPTANPTTSLWSEVGDGIDYYFVEGPELDDVIAGYRRVTGEAPMMPSWAFGLWQSRERYATQQASIDVAAGFRSRGVPLDVIVQDWQYWTIDTWGSHAFDPVRFPDPDGWISTLRDTHHTRMMISVWPKFYPGTANFEELRAAGFLFEPNLTNQRVDFLGYPFTFYDAFNPAARAMYWDQMRRELFDRGVEAWWMDATEPDIVEGPYKSPDEQLETFKTYMQPTALGSGARVLNAYSLVNSQAVYEGQRAAAPDQRVFILTRNGFAGQQRYAASTWSGDITSTWTALKKQIPAGLGFSISGIPYWTVDSGGFAVPPRFATNPTPEAVAEWNELNTRWFEYATFLPLLRVHGQAPLREMWEFGGDTSPTFQAQLKFDRLRYRLQPYIYSLAGKVTHEGGTLLRPLVMDFREDVLARDVRDQFSLGPALMVSPVTTYQAQSRSVYLPKGTWYDFWTGASVDGGQTVQAAALYDSIPVHVPAGSIIPFGPELAYTREKPADPIVLYVYAGADGAFTLYEDDGTTYAYERGELSRIPITWQDETRTLTVGQRQGTFPGLLAERTFQVVLVSSAKPVGFSFTPTADRSIPYSGEAVAVTF
jgi:alpha-D-xyloside xylohydrolase